MLSAPSDPRAPGRDDPIAVFSLKRVLRATLEAMVLELAHQTWPPSAALDRAAVEHLRRRFKPPPDVALRELSGYSDEEIAAGVRLRFKDSLAALLIKDSLTALLKGGT